MYGKQDVDLVDYKNEGAQEDGREKWWRTREDLDSREEVVDLIEILYSCVKFSNNNI